MAVTVTVENGTGVAGANSYLSVAGWKAYADQHGWDYTGPAYTDDQIGSALIRATSWLDNTYLVRWPGVRSNGASQALQWPRKAGSIQYGIFVADRYLTTVTDVEGVPIAVNVIPAALVSATAEAAWRELQSPNSLAPDLERGGAIRSLRAGSVAIEYATTAPNQTTFLVIDALLAGILTGGSESSGYTARAVRA